MRRPLLIPSTQGPPKAPGTVTVTAVGTERLDVSWIASPNDGVGLSAYLIERAVGAGAFAQIATVPASQVTFSDTGLVGGTTYSYRVRAINNNAVAGLFSPSAAGVPLSPAVPTPPQPTLVSVTATSATINGVNPGSPAVTMHVYRDGVRVTTGSGVPFGNYVVSGLSPATNYSITIAAVNAQGVESAQSAALVVTTSAGAGGGVGFDGPAELPRVQVDTTMPTVTGVSRTAANAAELTSVLALTQLGDEIVLTPGVDYGSRLWPLITAGNPSGWVTVRTSALPGLGFPLPGARVTPADTAQMPRFSGGVSNVPVWRFANGAQRYRFIGIHVQPNAGQFVNNMIEVTPFSSSEANIARDIIIDRCVLRGDPTAGTVRTIAFDAIRGAIIESHADHAFSNSADSQAVWIHMSPGPGLIRNSFLSGAGENILFGGAGASIIDMVPRDYTITDCTLHKDPAWRINPPAPVLKNCFEVKCGERILLQRCVIQNYWMTRPNGSGNGQIDMIVLTPRNQMPAANAPWTRVRDITIRFNRTANAWGRFVNNLFTDDEAPSQSTARIRIRDNLVALTNVYNETLRIQHVRMISGAIPGFSVEHNTFIWTSGTATYFSTIFEAGDGGSGGADFTFRNNIFPGPPTDILRSSTLTNNALLNAMYSGGGMTNAGNLYTGVTSGTVQSQLGGAANFYPANIAAIGFTDYAGGNYALAPSSPYKNAGVGTGRDLGADLSQVA